MLAGIRSHSVLPAAAIFLFSLLLLLPCSASSQGVKMVMVTEQWPPFRINDEKSPSGFRGIDIDIVRKLEEVLGITIEIQRVPWARALEMMRNGQADMVTGAAHTVEREIFMHYVPVSYYAVHPVFYTQKGKGQVIRSYQDLYGKTIGYSLNSAYFEPFNSDTKLNKVGLSTESQLLQVLALKRLDLVIGTEPNISYDRARLGYLEVLEPTVYQPLEKTELFITLSRKSKKAMEYGPGMERALRTFMKDGTIEALLREYR